MLAKAVSLVALAAVSVRGGRRPRITGGQDAGSTWQQSSQVAGANGGSEGKALWCNALGDEREKGLARQRRCFSWAGSIQYSTVVQVRRPCARFPLAAIVRSEAPAFRDSRNHRPPPPPPPPHHLHDLSCRFASSHYARTDNLIVIIFNGSISRSIRMRAQHSVHGIRSGTQEVLNVAHNLALSRRAKAATCNFGWLSITSRRLVQCPHHALKSHQCHRIGRKGSEKARHESAPISSESTLSVYRCGCVSPTWESPALVQRIRHYPLLDDITRAFVRD